MKNTITKKVNYLLTALLLCGTTAFSTTNASYPKKEHISIEDGDRYAVKAILDKMKEGHFFNTMVTSISEKKRGGKNHLVCYLWFFSSCW